MDSSCQMADKELGRPIKVLAKHLKPDCFVTEVCRNVMKLDYQLKRLKPDAVPTIFPRPIHGDGRPAIPPPRLTEEK